MCAAALVVSGCFAVADLDRFHGPRQAPATDGGNEGGGDGGDGGDGGGITGYSTPIEARIISIGAQDPTPPSVPDHLPE